jgi:hypothetical protein
MLYPEISIIACLLWLNSTLAFLFFFKIKLLYLKRKLQNR